MAYYKSYADIVNAEGGFLSGGVLEGGRMRRRRTTRKAQHGGFESGGFESGGFESGGFESGGFLSGGARKKRTTKKKNNYLYKIIRVKVKRGGAPPESQALLPYNSPHQYFSAREATERLAKELAEQNGEEGIEPKKKFKIRNKTEQAEFLRRREEAMMHEEERKERDLDLPEPHEGRLTINAAKDVTYVSGKPKSRKTPEPKMMGESKEKKPRTSKQVENGKILGLAAKIYANNPALGRPRAYELAYIQTNGEEFYRLGDEVETDYLGESRGYDKSKLNTVELNRLMYLASKKGSMK